MVVGKSLSSASWRLAQFLLGLGLGYYLPLLLPDQKHLEAPLPSPPAPAPAPGLTAAPLLPLVVGVMTAGQYLDTRCCIVSLQLHCTAETSIYDQACKFDNLL